MNNLNLFNGPVFTVFTAFDQNRRLDITSTLNYLDFLLEKGVSDFYVMPYNSRYLQLSPKEIETLNFEVVKHLKSGNSSQVIVSSPVECSTDVAIDYAKKARDCGADIFASAFGEKFFFNGQVVEHYQALAEVFPKLLVHEQPLISGHSSNQMNWPLSLLKDVASLQEVVAFKEDTKSESYGKSILSLELEAQLVFAGRKKLFLPLVEFGLNSYLNGISIVEPKIAFKFWELVQDGDSEQARRFVNEVDDPFWNGPVKKYGWHRVNKASLEIFGLMSREDRPPLPALNAKEFEDLREFWSRHQEVIYEWV